MEKMRYIREKLRVFTLVLGVDINLDGKGKNFYDKIIQGTPWMCTFGTICLPCLNVGYVKILT
jgi:hypothetical protein